MEEMKLHAVPELALIPIERRSLPEADHKQKIQRKRKERDKSARWLVRVAVTSLTMNMVQWVIIYILQAGPI